MTKLEDKIKKEIKSVKPVPFWEFFVFSASKDVLILFLWFISVLLAGMIFDVIVNFRQGDNLFVADKVSLSGFLMLPYELMVILLLLLLASYYLIKKVHLFYRFTRVTLLCVLAVSLALGFLLAQYTGFNRLVFLGPGIQTFYKEEGRIIDRGEKIIIGQVVDNSIGQIKVIDQTGKIYQLTINNQTRLIATLL